jgi:hypothetical protein
MEREIRFVQDYHGVDGAAENGIYVLEKILKEFHGVDIGMYHEAIPGMSGFDSVHARPCRELNADRISSKEFSELLDLREHWGPEGRYAELFDFAHRNGIHIHPLDKSILFRLHLTAEFQAFLLNLRHSKIGGMNDESKAWMSSKFDSLCNLLRAKREKQFAGNAFSSPHKVTLLFMHPGHIERTSNMLTGLQRRVTEVDPDMARKFSEEEDKIQEGFMGIALVPVVVKAFNAWATA